MYELIYLLVSTHLTIIAVTLYLHRSQSHRSVQFHPIVAHLFRFWLWFTTGMITREWVAVHRQHHQCPDQANDPHSPQVYGIWRVLFGGAGLYVRSKSRPEVLKLGIGTPNDWIENKVYTPYAWLGITLLLLVNLLCFSWWGLLLWAIQMVWIPFWAAGVINGVAHWWGYRNHQVNDASRNLVPWAIWIGGEELHNNHHSNGASAKFSTRAWEFDIGWMYIRILSALRLAHVR